MFQYCKIECIVTFWRLPKVSCGVVTSFVYGPPPSSSTSTSKSSHISTCSTPKKKKTSWETSKTSTLWRPFETVKWATRLSAILPRKVTCVDRRAPHKIIMRSGGEKWTRLFPICSGVPVSLLYFWTTTINWSKIWSLFSCSSWSDKRTEFKLFTLLPVTYPRKHASLLAITLTHRLHKHSCCITLVRLGQFSCLVRLN